jgi:hypothetical protein
MADDGPLEVAAVAEAVAEQAVELALGFFSPAVSSAFESHVVTLKAIRDRRREALKIPSLLSEVTQKLANLRVREAASDSANFYRSAFEGDAALAQLRALLKVVDQRGFERSAHQLQFHNSFERAVARILYRGEWGTSKPAIMAANGWTECPSEVLISTPRRFGKTFRCAPPLAPPLPPAPSRAPPRAASPSSAPASRSRCPWQKLYTSEC